MYSICTYRCVVSPSSACEWIFWKFYSCQQSAHTISYEIYSSPRMPIHSIARASLFSYALKFPLSYMHFTHAKKNHVPKMFGKVRARGARNRPKWREGEKKSIKVHWTRFKRMSDCVCGCPCRAQHRIPPHPRFHKNDYTSSSSKSPSRLPPPMRT